MGGSTGSSPQRQDYQGRGRILAVKWGMNPNSSSLGVDVTFLLVGASVLSILTPVLGAVLRWRSNKPVVDSPPHSLAGSAAHAGEAGVIDSPPHSLSGSAAHAGEAGV